METEILNATITNSFWESERGFTHYLLVEGDGWGGGFGGYSLKGNSCYLWITEIMKTLESKFSDKDLIGKVIRVKTNHSTILAIGHPIKDLWFEPAIFFKENI